MTIKVEYFKGQMSGTYFCKTEKQFNRFKKKMEKDGWRVVRV